MAGGIKGEEDTEERDHQHTGQKARRSANDQLGVAEEPALIGQQPLREIAPRFRTKQIDAVGQKALLQDVELGVHDLQQDACLLRQLAASPDEA